MAHEIEYLEAQFILLFPRVMHFYLIFLAPLAFWAAQIAVGLKLKLYQYHTKLHNFFF